MTYFSHCINIIAQLCLLWYKYFKANIIIWFHIRGWRKSKVSKNKMIEMFIAKTEWIRPIKIFKLHLSSLQQHINTLKRQGDLWTTSVYSSEDQSWHTIICNFINLFQVEVKDLICNEFSCNLVHLVSTLWGLYLSCHIYLVLIKKSYKVFSANIKWLYLYFNYNTFTCNLCPRCYSLIV